MNDEIIEVKKDDLRELYEVSTNYPAIAKEQVQNEMHKVFGEDIFKPKNIMERVKTFENACNELGIEPDKWLQDRLELGFEPDVIAYMKLRIICKALNEGWEPQFTEDEWRYFPWFRLYTQEEYDELDEEDKARVVLRSSCYSSSYGGVACVLTDSDATGTNAYFGSRLAFKSRELALYAGRQFAEIYADFNFRTNK